MSPSGRLPAGLDTEVAAVLSTATDDDFHQKARSLGFQAQQCTVTPGREAEGAHRLKYLLHRLEEADLRVRECMLIALGATRKVELAPVILARTREEPVRVRAAAYEALGALFESSQQVVALTQQYLPTFRAGLADPELLVQLYTVRGLRHVAPGREVFDLLISGLSHENPRIRAAAARSLAFVFPPPPDEAVTLALSRAIDDADEQVRNLAALSLTFSNHPSAVPALIRGLRHEWQGVWQGSLSALATIGDVSALPSMLRVLEWQGPKGMSALQWALGRIEPDRLLPALLSALQDPSPAVLDTATLFLGARGGVKEVTALAQRLGDAREPVQIAAARALAGIGKRLSKQRQRIIDLLKPFAAEGSGHPTPGPSFTHAVRAALAELAPPAAAPAEEISELVPSAGPRQEPEAVIRALEDLRFFEGLPASSATEIQKELRAGKVGAVFRECCYGTRHMFLDNFDLCSKGRAGSLVESLGRYLEAKGVPPLSVAMLGGTGDHQLVINGTSTVLATAQERKQSSHYWLIPLRLMNVLDGLLRAAGSPERVFFCKAEGSPDMDMYFLTLPMARALTGSGYWPEKLVLAAAALQGQVPAGKARRARRRP